MSVASRPSGCLGWYDLFLRSELTAVKGEKGKQERAVAGLAYPSYGVLWGLAIVLFGVGDLLTTSFALGLGAVEGSVVTKLLMDIFGGSVWTLTIVKSAILSSLLLLSYLKMGKYAWTIPAMLTCAGTFMLTHNIAVLLALL